MGGNGETNRSQMTIGYDTHIRSMQWECSRVFPLRLGFKDLSTAVVEREKSFIKNLVKKLLVYSTGRETTFIDEAEINEITNQVLKSKLGFKTLVAKTLTSEIAKRR